MRAGYNPNSAPTKKVSGQHHIGAGKHANVVMAATAREMLGFIWAIAQVVATKKPV